MASNSEEKLNRQAKSLEYKAAIQEYRWLWTQKDQKRMRILRDLYPTLNHVFDQLEQVQL